MKITVIDECPKGLRHFDRHEDDDDLESKLTPRDVEDIVEIFKTPLTGSYTLCLRKKIKLECYSRLRLVKRPLSPY